MEVALWVPALAALITGLSVYFAARAPRGQTKADRDARIAEEAKQEASVITAGFVALINEMQEQRQIDRDELSRLRQELADCLRARYEDLSQ